MPKHRRPGRPKSAPTVVVSGRVSLGVAEALKRYVAAVKPRTTDSYVVAQAVEEYLVRVGAYATPDADSADAD